MWLVCFDAFGSEKLHFVVAFFNARPTPFCSVSFPQIAPLELLVISRCRGPEHAVNFSLSIFVSLFGDLAVLSSPASTMAAVRPRPYRRILTSALHRRFVHASALAVLVCYVVAFAIGDKSSCEYLKSISLRPAANCLSSHSLLVMVSNRRLRYSYRSSLSLLLGRLCPACWSDAHRLENDHFLDQYRQTPRPSTLHSDFRMVPILRLVVQRNLQVVTSYECRARVGETRQVRAVESRGVNIGRNLTYDADHMNERA